MSESFSLRANPPKKTKKSSKKKEKPKESSEGKSFDPEFVTTVNNDLEQIKKDIKKLWKILNPKPKTSAEFVKFLRVKFNIPNLSKTDMRITGKLPNHMNYEEKQTMSGIMRHHGNLELVMEWIREFLSE